MKSYLRLNLALLPLNLGLAFACYLYHYQGAFVR
jgi:hypothetical protein